MDYRWWRIHGKQKKLTWPLDGHWMPVSVVAEITGKSEQTIRLWALSGQVEYGRFNKGPILVKIEDCIKKS